MTAITIIHYPNNQFIIWNPYHAEILRTVYAISIVGSGNSITISQVSPPLPFVYKTPTTADLNHNDPKTTKQQSTHKGPIMPTFENTTDEQVFDIYARIGAPPYAIPSFELLGLLLYKNRSSRNHTDHHEPQDLPQSTISSNFNDQSTGLSSSLDIQIIDGMTTQLVLTSAEFQSIAPKLISSLLNPALFSGVVNDVIDRTIQLELRDQEQITKTTSLLTTTTTTVVPPDPLAALTAYNNKLKQERLQRQQSQQNQSQQHQLTPHQQQLCYQKGVLSSVLSLFLHSPLARLHYDLTIRGLYVTEGFHYNISLIVYDALTHHRAYNQAPPAVLTGGNSLSTNTSTTTWHERDGSNSMWRCYPGGDVFRGTTEGFAEHNYRQEKHRLTQERLDNTRALWLQQEAERKLKMEAGRMKKYGNVHGRNGPVKGEGEEVPVLGSTNSLQPQPLSVSQTNQSTSNMNDVDGGGDDDVDVDDDDDDDVDILMY